MSHRKSFWKGFWNGVGRQLGKVVVCAACLLIVVILV